MQIRKKITVLLFGLLPLMASAGQPFTLKECLDFAVENNRKLQKDKLGLQTSQLERKELIGTLLPQVNASSGFTYNIQKTTFAMPNFINSMMPEALRDPNVPKYMMVSMGMDMAANWGASVSQQLVNFSLFNALAMANEADKMAKLGVELTTADVISQTALLFYNIQVLEYALTQFDESLALMDSTLNILNVNREMGLVRDVDVNRVSVQKSNLETERSSMEQALEVQKSLLKLQMGFPMDNVIEISPLDVKGMEEELCTARLNYFDVTRLPAYRLMEEQQTMAKLGLRGAKYETLPVVNLVGTYSMNYMGDDFTRDTFFKFPVSMVQLNLKVPLFTGLSKTAKVRKARIEIMKSNEDKQQLTETLMMGYNNARMQLDQNLKTIESQRKNKELAQDVFEVTNGNFNEGISSLSDVLNASSSLIQAQMNYISALNNSMKAYIDLKKADGSIYELR
jgi:outer membrane protein TolC